MISKINEEASTKEIRNNLGVIEFSRYQRIIIAKVNDRDGSQISIPLINQEKLKSLSILNSSTESTISFEDQIYFHRACQKLPYLLAVHATFNSHPQPNLDEFNNSIIPIIGFDGPPHSGKTAFLACTAVYEPDSIIGIRDFDCFSNQSISAIIDNLKQETNPDINSPWSTKVIDRVLEIYQKNSLNPKADNTDITLKSLLDNLLGEFRQLNQRKYYLLDLPGFDQNTPSIDVFHLLAASIPIVDFNEVSTLNGNRPVNVPLSERFGPNSASKFLLDARSKILPIRLQLPNLLHKARFIHEQIQNLL